MNITIDDNHLSFFEYNSTYILLFFWFILGVLLVAGVLGNVTLLYVLVVRWATKTSVIMYASTLAGCMLLKCCVHIPLVIYITLLSSQGKSLGNSICKFYRIATVYYMVSTSLILLVAAVNRYIMVKNPWRIQTKNYTRIKIGAALTLSAAMSLAAYPLYTASTLQEPPAANSSYNLSMTATAFSEGCHLSAAYRGSGVAKLFAVVLILVFIATTVTSIIIYAKVCRNVKNLHSSSRPSLQHPSLDPDQDLFSPDMEQQDDDTHDAGYFASMGLSSPNSKSSSSIVSLNWFNIKALSDITDLLESPFQTGSTTATYNQSSSDLNGQHETLGSPSARATAVSFIARTRREVLLKKRLGSLQTPQQKRPGRLETPHQTDKASRRSHASEKLHLPSVELPSGGEASSRLSLSPRKLTIHDDLDIERVASRSEMMQSLFQIIPSKMLSAIHRFRVFSRENSWPDLEPSAQVDHLTEVQSPVALYVPSYLTWTERDRHGSSVNDVREAPDPVVEIRNDDESYELAKEPSEHDEHDETLTEREQQGAMEAARVLKRKLKQKRLKELEKREARKSLVAALMRDSHKYSLSYQLDRRGVLTLSRTAVTFSVVTVAFLLSYLSTIFIITSEVFVSYSDLRRTWGRLFVVLMYDILFFTCDVTYPFVWVFVNETFKQEVRDILKDIVARLWTCLWPCGSSGTMDV